MRKRLILLSFIFMRQALALADCLGSGLGYRAVLSCCFMPGLPVIGCKVVTGRFACDSRLPIHASLLDGMYLQGKGTIQDIINR